MTTLRASQIETLKLVDSFPDKQVIASDLAHAFGTTIRSGESRLARLEAHGLLAYVRIPWLHGRWVFVYRLTDKGRSEGQAFLGAGEERAA